MLDSSSLDETSSLTTVGARGGESQARKKLAADHSLVHILSVQVRVKMAHSLTGRRVVT